METRLFFIGLAMAGYAWLSRRFKQRNALDTANKAGLWHGAFCALSGFSITMVLVMSMDTRAKFISIAIDVISTTELYPSLAAGFICALVGFWRGRASWE